MTALVVVCPAIASRLWWTPDGWTTHIQFKCFKTNHKRKQVFFLFLFHIVKHFHWSLWKLIEYSFAYQENLVTSQPANQPGIIHRRLQQLRAVTNTFCWLPWEFCFQRCIEPSRTNQAKLLPLVIQIRLNSNYTETPPSCSKSSCAGKLPLSLCPVSARNVCNWLNSTLDGFSGRGC